MTKTGYPRVGILGKTKLFVRMAAKTMFKVLGWMVRPLEKVEGKILGAR